MAYTKKAYGNPGGVGSRSYARARRRGMGGFGEGGRITNVYKTYPMGMGDASSCGSDQIWDPNYVLYPGTSWAIKGQCVTPAQQLANQQAHPEQYSGSGGGGAGGSGFSDFLTGLAKAFGSQQTPQQPVVVQQSGISTSTLIIGGVALVGLALIMRRKS